MSKKTTEVEIERDLADDYFIHSDPDNHYNDRYSTPLHFCGKYFRMVTGLKKSDLRPKNKKRFKMTVTLTSKDQ